ncbi:MAG: glycine--tRNA ligase subunit beta [Granulosicoccus sp.]
MADLLIEIGAEDLPAASLLPMAQHLGAALHEVLQAAGLADTAPRIYATPRRIAALWPGVGERQADQLVERRGPAVAAAYKDGEPSKALMGFLKSAGARVDELSTVSTPKGEWVTLSQTKAGRLLADVVADTMPGLIKSMPMPKRMRWGGDSHEFLRPVTWLLVLHGEQVLPLKLLGMRAGNSTIGHRFHAPDPIELKQAADYEAVLEASYVMVDFAKRRQRIAEQVKAEARRIGGQAVMGDELLDEVTGLVEWPVALSGSFDAEFLEIPKEALIQTMQENQRYFALLDKAGELMPAFITVANIESSNPATIVDGNERVIRPRFADTMFFWQQDKKLRLEARRTELNRLLFQEKLGSTGDKVERLASLVAWLAPKLDADITDSVQAAQLCKCDLVSEIVKELPKMQGIAGRYYAQRDGYNESISHAMEEHYYPKQAGGTLPQGRVSQTLSIADKMDTLTGIYGQGLVPSSTRDPFGLRRIALGVLRIIIEGSHDVDLAELLEESVQTYKAQQVELSQQGIIDYVTERLRGYLLEQGYAVDAIDAVLAKSLTRPVDIMARLEAINEFRTSDAAQSLAAASKRIGNLLKKFTGDVSGTINAELLNDPAEQALAAQLATLQGEVEQPLAKRNYAEAMTLMARLKEPVDAFFESVMVMTDDTALRDNRLAMLKQLDDLCCYTAELSRLTPPVAESPDVKQQPS